MTMHPHGLEYKKDAEGAMYTDGTSGSVKADDKVAAWRNLHLSLDRSGAERTCGNGRKFSAVDVSFPLC